MLTENPQISYCYGQSHTSDRRLLFPEFREKREVKYSSRPIIVFLRTGVIKTVLKKDCGTYTLEKNGSYLSLDKEIIEV